jgi:hypothetical protein
MGMQTCAPTGDGYTACMGCPPPPAAGQSGGAAGAGAGTIAGTTAGTMAGTTAGMAGAMAGTAGNDADASVSEGDGGEPLPAADVEPGVSCGVGLVVQCEQDTQKCCARSLEPDTCIDASSECSCGLQGCSTLQAYCDGPEDCPDGQVCCGTLAGNSYNEFRCAASCDSRGTQRIACHQQEPKCEGNLVCANSQLLTNVQVCIDPATIQQ